MSRASVRAAVASWFAPPAVPGLNRLDRSQPKIAEANSAFFGPGSPSGAIGFVFIEREEERRVAIGGPYDGMKRLVYDVSIVLMFRSSQPDAESAMDDYDVVIEGIKTRLRHDRTLGGTVFEAGEGNGLGGNDVEVISDLPQLMDDITHIWSAVRFRCVELIHS